MAAPERDPRVLLAAAISVLLWSSAFVGIRYAGRQLDPGRSHSAGERHLDAGIAALLVNVGPIFIAILAGLLLNEGFPRLLLLGWLILGEVPPLLALPGGLLCLAGVAIARRRPAGDPVLAAVAPPSATIGRG
jgi:hypothetical protein